MSLNENPVYSFDDYVSIFCLFIPTWPNITYLLYMLTICGVRLFLDVDSCWSRICRLYFNV